MFFSVTKTDTSQKAMHLTKLQSFFMQQFNLRIENQSKALFRISIVFKPFLDGTTFKSSPSDL